jgi:hypothetical protein
MKRFLRGRRLLLPVILAGLFATAAFAFTASNTVPDSKAGDGSGAITGYTVSAIHYSLNATDGTKIDQVSFTLDSTPPSGSVIKIQLVTGGSWYSCTNSGTSVTCATTSPQATVLPSDNLRVIAVQ